MQQVDEVLSVLKSAYNAPMSQIERFIMVCTNEMPEDHPLGCCHARNSPEILKRFDTAARNSLLDGDVVLRVSTSGCFGLCENGPVMVVYPEGVWYGGVAPEDVDQIVTEHLVGGSPVERLRLRDSLDVI